MLKKFFIFLNVLALIVLLLSCLAAYIEPGEYWLLPFIGFAFPVVLVVNVLFLLVWLAMRNWLGLIPLIAILFAWKFIHSTFAMNFVGTNKEEGIKLMTWNVKNFDLYNWSHNMETRSKMMDLIKKENPDVLCLQEFYSSDTYIANVQFIRDSLGYKYVFFPPATEIVRYAQNKHQKMMWGPGGSVHQWGVATFSKFPIVDTGRVNFNGMMANSCIYTDLDLGGKRVRLYNVHFQSIHLGYEDYATLDEIEVNQNTRWVSIKKIMRKMKTAYQRRSQQANSVIKHMNDFKGTKILCGDFNDVPVSYTYNTVSKNMNDAFVEKGKGFGHTFVDKASIFRIDYALFDPAVKINSYHRISKDLSDHYPVCVTFSP